MATFDFLVKQAQKKQLDLSRINEFSDQVISEISKGNHKISDYQNQKILLVNGVALSISELNEVKFIPTYDCFLNEKCKKIILNLFEDKKTNDPNQNSKNLKYQEIINFYNKEISDCSALSLKKDMAGKIRYKKGELVESLAEKCCKLAIDLINEEKNLNLTCSIEKETVCIKHKEKPELSYNMIVDRLVKINGNPVAHIEAKSYADLSMYKRAVGDASLVQESHKLSECILFELEKGTAANSNSVEVVNSYYPNVKMNCFSLFNHKRQANKEIHKEENMKELTMKQVEDSVIFFKDVLKKYI